MEKKKSKQIKKLQLGIKMTQEELDRLNKLAGVPINFSAFARERINEWCDLKEKENKSQTRAA